MNQRIENKLFDMIYYGCEKIFKIWQIVSWILLLLGYSFLIIAGTLFGESPIWLEVFGYIAIYATLVNFFIALFIAIIFIIKGLKEKDNEIIHSRAYLILFYNCISGLMYFAMTF